MGRQNSGDMGQTVECVKDGALLKPRRGRCVWPTPGNSGPGICLAALGWPSRVHRRGLCPELDCPQPISLSAKRLLEKRLAPGIAGL